MWKYSLFIITLLFSWIFLSPSHTLAQTINCPNRYVTFVNPIRGRDLWITRDMDSMKKQYLALAKYNFPATWLLQHDALMDKDVIETIKSFDIKGEQGVFLEVTKPFAESAGVVFPERKRWSDPGAIFFSAYTQSDRRLLIDKLYSDFKNIFGHYPKSVGAWWIDSYSLNYIQKKYGVKSIMIVADQKTTDSYGVWGQWWGFPYHPSSENIIVPGSMDAVVIQWAQRDPILAYGDGQIVSNFSLQANDYIRSGKNTGYFSALAAKYIDCKNDLGQITIGMETGMEASAFQKEYENQLAALSKIPALKAVTMSDFSDKYKSVYPKNPANVSIGGWIMTPTYRENKEVGDRIDYKSGISFADTFVPDRSGFLNRNLLSLKGVNPSKYFPWWIITSLISGYFLIRNKKSQVLLWSVVFGAVSYGLIFRSFIRYGWQIFYGPVTGNLVIAQIFLSLFVIGIGLIVFAKKSKLPKLLLWLVPLSFGLDLIVSYFRYTNISNIKYFGILLNKVSFAGFSYGTSLNPVFQNFPIGISNAFLKFPFDKIWASLLLYLVIYPLLHIFIAIPAYFLIIKLPVKARRIIMLILVIALTLQVFTILKADPRIVFPVL